MDEDAWKNASNAQRWAVFQKFYQLYEIDKMEDRLADGMWYMAHREVDLSTEGEGRAELIYMNKFEDSISIRCRREDGLWSLSRVEFNFPEEREKPKDD